ncbi:MAG: glucan 1,4-alpha-glucosidase [Gemmataceae bacterium]
MSSNQHAPGWPGLPPRWTSSAKVGVGTARNRSSRIWFTLSHGIINEIYYPRVDTACVRDMELIVTDGRDFFSEEKRHTEHKIEYLAPGVPGYRLINTCTEGRYRLTKEIVGDPERDVLVQRLHFEAIKGKREDYRLFALLAPHLGNRGRENSAWVDDYKGSPMLFAHRDGISLAFGCARPWKQRSVGFAGVSDGWQDLSRNRQLTWNYRYAENGTVALSAEIDLGEHDEPIVLAIGFSRLPNEAGHRVLASLYSDFDKLKREYVDAWQAWQDGLLPLDKPKRDKDLYRVSTAMLRTHEAKNFPGGMIASLSIPWGFNKGDDDLGGYHLVWPRDLVETAGGLIAAGAHDDAHRVLKYLRISQEADGHWSQNLWLDGTPYWEGVQMDETAFPILLVDLARREQVVPEQIDVKLWPMVKRAASFLVKNGPVTQEDRWEEDAGYSPFTLAVEIAGLLAAADIADHNGEPVMAAYMRETADTWHDAIDRWTYTTGTRLCRELDVEGYYVRIAPPETADAVSPLQGFVPIKNRPPEQSNVPAEEIISIDALALVRFGLRAPDDPRILNTLKVIDSLLKVETKRGVSWYRYNQDGYGEHEDGRPFDGTGVGRAWPLLTAERAHYELAAGRPDRARELLGFVENFTGPTGLIPEQVWDTDDVKERELVNGLASGSAMPLVWAHSEYIKLRRSLRDGKVFDMPPQTVQRYLVKKVTSPRCSWRFNHKCVTITRGKDLRVEVLAPAKVHWTLDGWQTTRDSDTTDTGLGIHYVDLPMRELPAGRQVNFTFFWLKGDRWEGKDFTVRVE